jgi:hypothetical protein
MHPPGGRGDAISSAMPEADLTGTPYSAAMRAAALIAPLASAGEGKIARSIRDRRFNRGRSRLEDRSSARAGLHERFSRGFRGQAAGGLSAHGVQAPEGWAGAPGPVVSGEALIEGVGAGGRVVRLIPG